LLLDLSVSGGGMDPFLQTTKNHHFCDGFLIDSVWVARDRRSWLDGRVMNSLVKGFWRF
jgi:hypothetical protein